MPESEANSSVPRILYCRCAYAQTVPEAVKNEVLQRLSESGQAFEAVSDLCEMSASQDPRLQQIANGEGTIRIAACYPRAVKWLFHAAGSPLPEKGVEVVNMRELSGAEAANQTLGNEPVPTESESATA